MSLTPPAVLIPAIALILLCACRDVDYLPADRAERNEIVSSLEAFRRDTGRYPSSAEGLTVLSHDTKIPGWEGPYYPESKSVILAKYEYSLSESGTPKLNRKASSQ